MNNGRKVYSSEILEYFMKLYDEFENMDLIV